VGLVSARLLPGADTAAQADPAHVHLRFIVIRTDRDRSSLLAAASSPAGRSG
jgi:hypothetical protein